MKTVKVKTDKKTGKRITSQGVTLPKGIYLHNRNAENPSYRVYINMDGKKIYIGTFDSVNKAYKARNTRFKELTTMMKK
jgi:hypothetical protein